MKKFDVEKLTSDGKIEKVYGVPTINGLCVKVYRSGRKNSTTAEELETVGASTFLWVSILYII